MTEQERREHSIRIMRNERPGCGQKLTYPEGEKCEALDMAIKALNKCDRIEKIINSNDADFIANYVRGLFVE